MMNGCKTLEAPGMRGLTSGILFSANTRGSQTSGEKKSDNKPIQQRIVIVISASIITGA